MQVLSRSQIMLLLLLALGIIGLWSLFTPPGLLGKADAVGYAICHRISVRSFFGGERQLPLCARCTGIYLGAMTGLGVTLASGRTRAAYLPHWRVAIPLAGFVAALGVDGLNSYLTLFPGYTPVYEPNNTLRLMTGVFCGLTLINLVFPVFNQSIWEDGGQTTAPIRNLKELAGLMLVAVMVILLVQVENTTLRLSLGFISAAGVIIVLTMIMTVGVTTTLGRFRTYSTWRQAAPFLLAGLTLAIFMIGSIDFLRHTVTGTWAGFQF